MHVHQLYVASNLISLVTLFEIGGTRKENIENSNEQDVEIESWYWRGAIACQGSHGFRLRVKTYYMKFKLY